MPPVKRSFSSTMRSRKGTVHPAMGPSQIAATAELFAVLSEGSRLRILQILQNEPASVGELVARLELKQANVSTQLGILLAAGVVARRQEGNRAIFSIAMPLVHDLCELVCHGVRQQAIDRAAALGG
jgi:DNA-binding transcriptional ArsR family regulator